MSREHLEKAVEIVGSQSELARRLTDATNRTIRQAHIWNWLNRDQRVPAEVVIHIERATEGAVSRSELRPDLYPPDEAA
jgi:DNA-binding transcriptional regulator YdaS (Cro superfamily)